MTMILQKKIYKIKLFKILKNSKPNKKNKFKFKIDKWGVDLQSEHERFLVEKHFKCPLIIFDYPEEIKAFYMRLNENKKTVGAMDVLFPDIGEIIGGSQREERLDILISRMKKLKIDQAIDKIKDLNHNENDPYLDIFIKSIEISERGILR